jgi:hypothetical protein
VVAKTEKPLGFTKTVGVPRDAVAGFRRALQDKGGRPRRVPEGRLRPALVELPETLGELGKRLRRGHLRRARRSSPW